MPAECRVPGVSAGGRQALQPAGVEELGKKVLAGHYEAVVCFQLDTVSGRVQRSCGAQERKYGSAEAGVKETDAHNPQHLVR